jgi:hypothetical protein
MVLAITGGILVGGVALAALYDSIARRHGKSVGVSMTGPWIVRNRPGNIGLTHYPASAKPGQPEHMAMLGSQDD